MAMTESEIKYLKLARTARNNDNTEDAKRYYDMVRTENPENGEANAFYQIYSFWEGKKGEAENRFENITKVLVPSVDLIARAEEPEADKMDAIGGIIKEFASVVFAANKTYMELQTGSTAKFPSKRIITSGALGLYNLGDAIAAKFSNNSTAMKLAAKSWDEGVQIQNKYYAKQFDYRGRTVADYVAKIQKVDPSYVAPKKPGCISISK